MFQWELIFKGNAKCGLYRLMVFYTVGCNVKAGMTVRSFSGSCSVVIYVHCGMQLYSVNWIIIFLCLFVVLLDPSNLTWIMKWVSFAQTLIPRFLFLHLTRHDYVVVPRWPFILKWNNASSCSFAETVMCFEIRGIHFIPSCSCISFFCYAIIDMF